MYSKYFVTGIGNAIIDVLTFVKDDFLTQNSLSKGSMTLIDQNSALSLTNLKYNSICAGGSVANSIATIANFNVKNAFIGNVGSGNYGTIFQEDLARNNVDFHCKEKTKFGSTARSFIMITPDGERTMCTYLGEASNIAKEIDENVIVNSQYLFIEGYLWSGKETREALKKAMVIATNNRVKIALTLSDHNWVRQNREDFLKFASIVDILFANEKEIKALIGSDKIDATAIRQLAGQNEKLVLVITRSEKDAIIYTASDQKFIRIKASKVTDVIDSTGAGDAFAAGFFIGLYHNLSYEDSAKVGHLFASHIIQTVGGRLNDKQILEIKKILQTASLHVA